MLVLTRKLKESIHIGDEITVTIVRVKGNAVRIGIEAPQHVRVMRGELRPLSDSVGTLLERRVSRGESVVVERDEMDGSEELNEEWSLSAPCLAVADVMAR